MTDRSQSDYELEIKRHKDHIYVLRSELEQAKQSIQYWQDQCRNLVKRRNEYEASLEQNSELWKERCIKISKLIRKDSLAAFAFLVGDKDELIEIAEMKTLSEQLSEAKQRIAELDNPERIKEIAIKFGEHIEEKFLASKGLFLSTKEYYEWIETPEGKKLLSPSKELDPYEDGENLQSMF